MAGRGTPFEKHRTGSASRQILYHLLLLRIYPAARQGVLCSVLVLLRSLEVTFSSSAAYPLARGAGLLATVTER